MMTICLVRKKRCPSSSGTCWQGSLLPMNFGKITDRVTEELSRMLSMLRVKNHPSFQGTELRVFLEGGTFSAQTWKVLGKPQ